MNDATVMAIYRAGAKKGSQIPGLPRTARVVAIERDTEGLQMALREIFEESFIADANASVMDSEDFEAWKRAEDDIPERSLSPGYYSRAAYLLDLASAIEAGVTFAASGLTRSEVTGLEALRRAKAAFEGDHPQCPGCGKRQDNRHMTQCPHCKTKFAGKGTDMATAVTIQITVDAGQAEAAVKALNKTLTESGTNADVAFKKGSDGVQKMTGHVNTNLDSVRLLSQEFGLRLPRAIEAMLSRMPAVTNALSSMLSGLVLIAAAQVFVRLAEDGYRLYQQYISLNAEAEKFYETLVKTSKEDISQTRSIETTRRRADLEDARAAQLPKLAANLRSSSLSGLWADMNDIGGVKHEFDPAGHLAGLLASKDVADDGAASMANSVKLSKVLLDQTHEQVLAQINLDHALDGALVGQQKINAEVEKKQRIHAENRDYDRKVEMSLGNLSPSNAGAAKQRMEDQQAEAEGHAQSIVQGRAAALSLMKAHDELIQSNLRGDELYQRRRDDLEREVSLSARNEGKSQQEAHAAILVGQSKLDQEYFDKWLKTQEQTANSRIVGLTGAARISAEHDNAIALINLDHPGLDQDSASRKRVQADEEEKRRLKEIQENFTESTLASIAERTDADLNAYARIESEGTKALRELQKAYDAVAKNQNGQDIGSPALRSATDAARLSIQKQTQDDRNRLTQENYRQDLEYAQQASRAEARVKEDGITGWVAAYKNGIIAIRDQEDQLTVRMLEEAQKQGASEQEISQRKIDIHREANAQIAQQDQQLKHQIAGTLQEAFTNPVQFIKSAMEKMFFEILAGWIMKMKAFQAIFGNTLGSISSGRPGPGGLLAAGLGSSTSSPSGNVAGQTTSLSSASQGTTGSGSAIGSVGNTISSVSNLAQIAGSTNSSFPNFSGSMTGDTPDAPTLDLGGFNGSMTGDTPDLTDAQYAAQQGTAGGSSTFGYLGAGMGAYQGVTGTLSAFKSGNPLSGALSDAAAGAAIGSIVPGVGTAIGAAAGAAVGAASGFAGLIGDMGAKMAARDYYNKQVFPSLDAMMAHPTGDFQSAIANANSTANGALLYMGTTFGVGAANWVNDNYMKKELQKVDALLSDTASGGRYATTLSANQFHSGGLITGFGDYATSHNEGMVHAMLGETVMNPAASDEHGAMLAMMNSGASAAQVASRYLAGGASGAAGAAGRLADGPDIHLHTLDTRTLSGWLKTGGAQLIKKHLNDYSSQYSGDGVNG